MPIPNIILQTLATELVIEIAEQLAYEANTVQAEVDQYLGTVAAAGLTQEAIRDLVFGGNSVTARTFTESFKRRIVSIIDGAINKSWGDGMVARLNADDVDAEKKGRGLRLFTWRVESAKPCPDCSGRNGEKRSLAEWQSAGLPRSGWSLCGRNCKCILDSKGQGNFNYKRKRGLG